MRLQARFLVLFMFLFAVVGALVALQHYFDLDRSRYVLQNELKTRQGYFTKTVAMDGRQLESMAVDYSFWDEMVNFVKTSNPTFAHDNIDTGIATYSAEAAWVYRLDNSLVYFKSASDNSELQALNLPANFFTQLATKHFAHFFIKQADTLLEVQAATIHPGSDDERKTPPQGYLLVARAWDANYITSLSELTQSQVKLAAATASYKGHLGVDTVSFGSQLLSWDNQPLAVLSSTSNVPIVGDLHQVYTRQLFLLVALAMATTLVLVGAIWYMVLSPLRIITASLRSQTPDMLNKLAAQPTEFGSLANAMQLFFAQELKIKESAFIKTKLTELNQSKSEFLAIAAHELKGSVGNIHVFSENLVELLTKRTPKARLVAEAQHISQQARKATVLINDLYQASKGGQSISVHPVSFDFDAFIAQEIADAQYSTHQEIVLTGATHAQLTSDRDRLSQVVSNLLRNASKYSALANQIRVIVKQTQHDIVIEVQDDGIGIAEADQPHIFNRFYRSEKVVSAYPGLGLGLSICKEITAALGGKIWFHSELRHGSQFFVSLPTQSEDKAVKQSA